MNEYDLVDIRIPVDIGEKIFEVRRIRVEDVFRAIRRFDEPLRAFVQEDAPDAEKLLASLGMEDTADLFSFALDPYDPLHIQKHLTMETARVLWIKIGVVNDLDRIWKSLKLGHREESPARPGRPAREDAITIAPLVWIIDRLAMRYGIDPLIIPRWPYEAFLDFVDCAEEDRRRRELIDGAAAANLDPDLLDDSQIPVGPIPDLNKLVN